MTYDPNVGFDPTTNPWAEGGLSGAVANSLQPFMQGTPGWSPMTQAGVGAFMQNELPLIQNQMQLQGLGNGPAVSDVMGRSLATSMPQWIQGDMANRLTASNQASQFGASNLIPAWDQQLKGQAQALQGLSSSGEVIRGMGQDVNDAQREEMLRQQGISEATTTGLFGSQSPTQITTSSPSGGK